MRDNKAQLMTIANEASKIILNIMMLYGTIKAALQCLKLAKNFNEQLVY
ncbi:MAG: hypothetical protein Q8Q54_03255 [Methylococcales bacterium]|nr:hypothetical protein [Methylococcales bacterium]MDP3837919.1 hypothetical protein [Methylococcales bacterium]